MGYSLHISLYHIVLNTMAYRVVAYYSMDDFAWTYPPTYKASANNWTFARAFDAHLLSFGAHLLPCIAFFSPPTLDSIPIDERKNCHLELSCLGRIRCAPISTFEGGLEITQVPWACFEKELRKRSRGSVRFGGKSRRRSKEGCYTEWASG